MFRSEDPVHLVIGWTCPPPRSFFSTRYAFFNRLNSVQGILRSSAVKILFWTCQLLESSSVHKDESRFRWNENGLLQQLDLDCVLTCRPPLLPTKKNKNKQVHCKQLFSLLWSAIATGEVFITLLQNDNFAKGFGRLSWFSSDRVPSA